MNRVRTGLLLCVFALGFPSAASAGRVCVSCDPGSFVTVQWKDRNGVWQIEGQTDVNRDGKVEFGIPDQAGVQDKLFICKDSDGRRIWYELNLVVGGTTLAALEPFELPTFGAAQPAGRSLLAVVNIAAFLDEGNPFSPGQLVRVNQGALKATSTIVIHDGTDHLSDDPATVAKQLQDEEFVRRLPRFSGAAVVSASDLYLKHFVASGFIPELRSEGGGRFTFEVVGAGDPIGDFFGFGELTVDPQGNLRGWAVFADPDFDLLGITFHGRVSLQGELAGRFVLEGGTGKWEEVTGSGDLTGLTDGISVIFELNGGLDP